jgi:hypothetical protein
VPTLTQELEGALAEYPEQVLVIAGAGVARASDPSSPAASWTGLLATGVERRRERCPQLEENWFKVTTDLIEEGKANAPSLVMAATRIEKALTAVHAGQYGAWLTDTVGRLTPRDHRVIRSLLDWQTRIATLNYDNLFEIVGNLPAVTWLQPDRALRTLRGMVPGVLHLHGHFWWPESVVFGERTYENIRRDPTAQSLLRSIFTLHTVVFVGCGGTTADPNFEGLWAFCKESLALNQLSHFHLVKTEEMAALAQRYTGLPVRPVPYGRRHEDLAPFLTELTERVRARQRPPTVSDALIRSQSDYASAIEDLRRHRGEMPADEFVRRAFAVIQVLRAGGGRRVSALEIDGILRLVASDLTSGPAVSYGLVAAEWLLEEGLDFFASRRLQAISQHLDACPAAPAELNRFRELLARTLSAQAEIDEALRTIDDAIPLLPADAQDRMKAERAELNLLTGDLETAGGNGGEV